MMPNDEEKENLHKMKRYEVFFLSELRDKDIFSVQKGRMNDRIIIRGVNETNCDTSFDVLIDFDK